MIRATRHRFRALCCGSSAAKSCACGSSTTDRVRCRCTGTACACRTRWTACRRSPRSRSARRELRLPLHAARRRDLLVPRAVRRRAVRGADRRGGRAGRRRPRRDFPARRRDGTRLCVRRERARPRAPDQCRRPPRDRDHRAPSGACHGDRRPARRAISGARGAHYARARQPRRPVRRYRHAPWRAETAAAKCPARADGFSRRAARRNRRGRGERECAGETAVFGQARPHRAARDPRRGRLRSVCIFTAIMCGCWMRSTTAGSRSGSIRFW